MDSQSRGARIALIFVIQWVLAAYGLLGQEMRVHAHGHNLVSSPADSQTVRRRSPTGAMVRSLLVPGWGQWYNGKKWKAALAFSAEVALAANAVVQNQYLQRAEDPATREYYLSNRNTSNWVLGLVVLLSMLDAYVDAHFSDFDESPELTNWRSFGPDGSTRFGFGGVRMSLSLNF